MRLFGRSLGKPMALDYIFACCGLLLLIIALESNAQPTSRILQIDGSQRVIDLQPWLELKRTDSDVSFENILSGTGAWTAASNYSNMHFGYSSDSLWMKINIQSVAPRETHWHIYFPFSSLSKVTLFREGQPERVSGLSVPLSERDFPHRNAVFMFPLDPGEQTTLYLRIESAGGLGIATQLWSSSAFASHSVSSTAMVMLYCGLLLGLGFYHVLVAGLLRDTNYLLYGSHLLLFALAVVAFSGIGGRYLWPEAGEWGARLLPFGLTAANACALLVLRNLFTNEAQPSTYRVLLNVVVLVSAVLAPVSLFLSPGSVSASIPWLALLGTLLAFACLVRAVRLHLPAARLFLLGAIFISLSIALFALRATGFVPSYLLTDLAIQACSAASMLVTAFALAYRTHRQTQGLLTTHQTQVTHLDQAYVETQEQLHLATRERDDAQLRLKTAALEDPLTKLPNRAALDRHINQALRRSKRRTTPLAVMLIELDEFKHLHDQLGDDTADSIRCVIAERLEQAAGENDFVAHLGGDEFILVADDLANPQQAQAIAERLLDMLSASIELEDQSVAVGVNIGVTLTHAAELDMPLLLRQADAARYSRKRSGRGGVSFHAPDSADNQPN